MNNLSPLCLLAFVFGPPLLIGLSLRGVKHSDFSRWAGYMTLKPLVATPIYALWMAVLLSGWSPGSYTNSMGAVALPLALPGLLLTIWITSRYSGDSFIYHPRATWFLLLLDFFRWGGSSWMLALPEPIPAYGVMLASGLPLVFSIAALLLARADDPFATPEQIEARQKSRKLKEDFVYSTSIMDSVEEPRQAPEPLKQWDTIQLADGEVAEVVEDDPQLAKRKRG
jgi:hypothetical protein